MGAAAARSIPAARRAPLLWLLLLVGFSPALAELAGSVLAGFVPASILLAPVLMALCIVRGSAPGGARGLDGLALVAAGGALQLFGIYADSWTFTRLGLPVAVIGLARYLGRPSVRVALLSLAIVPPPDGLVNLYTPVPEGALLALVCSAWRTLGLSVSCVGPIASAGDRSLEVIGYDVGLPLAVVLAELGWYTAVRAGATWARAVRTALLFAAATLLVQPLAVALAVALMASGAEDLARTWLDDGVWLLCASLVVGVGLVRNGWRTGAAKGDRSPEADRDR